MNPDELHRDAVVIDGLIIANWSRGVFEDMRRGGLTTANCTCCVWENFRGAMDNIAGEDCVGIGTDFTQGYERPFFDWLTHDKGYARKLTEFGDIVNPQGIRTIGEFPNLTAAMHRAGWNEARIRKVIGGNWLALLDEVWKA